MKLFHNPASPFVRKVMMVLHETGQLGDVELVAAAGHVLDVSNMPVADNPLGKIPTLVRPDAPTLYDSRVICRYLDVRAGGDLCGRGEMLWDYATIEATADGIMDACVLMVYERRVRPADKRFPDWVEGQWAKAERATQALNDRWLIPTALVVDRFGPLSGSD